MVTPAIQADLREILAWHAKRCAAALVGSVYKVRMCYLLSAYAVNTYEECNLSEEEPGVKHCTFLNFVPRVFSRGLVRWSYCKAGCIGDGL